MPQHDDEMRGCDGGESRKKYIDGAWLNPKHFNNWKSAGKG